MYPRVVVAVWYSLKQKCSAFASFPKIPERAYVVSWDRQPLKKYNSVEERETMGN